MWEPSLAARLDGRPGCDTAFVVGLTGGPLVMA